MRETDQDFFFDRDLCEVDPDAAEIISLEEERQARKLILIASESICPRPVRAALASCFTNLYAEGYPHLRMSRYERDRLLDFFRQTAYLRRYADRRYYKGTDYADFIEALAQRRVADLFATDKDPGPKLKIPSSSIFANVQPLSGAAANNAVYEAFLEPGDVVMGMSLSHGGHLTHGSPANRSGKRYRVVSYGVDSLTGRLDYDAIGDLAEKHRPKMIIAGYSAYPWSVDWEKFARIRDRVGECILLADIAHPAGLVAGGVYPNPVGYADVITFTTHKTLCGPRGACILTTDEEKARIIDSAVFPGEQGGPHINTIAAKAVCFRIAKTPEFRRLQKKIVQNAKHLGRSLERLGLTLAYGGTDSHLLLVDLRRIGNHREPALTAEVTTRILDICGIVANKNTIAGDENAVYPSGVRFGTTWITQRGITRGQLETLAELIYRVLAHIVPYEYIGASCRLGRGKIDRRIIEEVTSGVARLESRLMKEIDVEERRTYPHYSESSPRALENSLIAEYRKLGATVEKSAGIAMPLQFGEVKTEIDRALNGAVLFDRQDAGLFEVYGERASAFLEGALTVNISELDEGDCEFAYVLDERSRAIDDVIVTRLRRDTWGEDHFLVFANPENSERVRSWFRALSDGYVLFDRDDVHRKIEGPVTVVDLKSDLQKAGQCALFSLQGPRAKTLLSRVFPSARHLEEWTSREVVIRGLRFRVLHLLCGEESRFEFLLKCKDLHRFFRKFSRFFRGNELVPAGTLAGRQKRLRFGFPRYDGRRPTGTELQKAQPKFFALEKTYFVGQGSLLKKQRRSSRKRPYVYRKKRDIVKHTWLYSEHVKLGGRLVDFAGWKMPVWYSRVSDEHAAVRKTAGLFDVSHMGVIDVKGRDATRFLNAVTTNYVSFLRVGQSQYSYLLYPDGEVVDDIMIYRLGPEKYMIVVNALNEEKDLAWLEAVQSRQYIIDPSNQMAEVDGEVSIRSLKDSKSGKDMRIDLALQGPNSLLVLQELARDSRVRRRLRHLGRSEFLNVKLSGADTMVSRTGYTGEDIGYELFVHPDRAPRLWNRLLEEGDPYGITPVGIGARDSTRIEAGFPLYGQELAGPHGISPIEAGYGAFVKLHKPFFIGRKMMREKALKREMEVVRFQVKKSGQRAVNPGDPIISSQGENVGHVTSCTLIGGLQQGLGYVRKRVNVEGTTVSILAVRKGQPQERSKDRLKLGDRVVLPIEATVLSRFAKKSTEPGTSE